MISYFIIFALCALCLVWAWRRGFYRTMETLVDILTGVSGLLRWFT